MNEVEHVKTSGSRALKIVIEIVSFLVGGLFIFSGLIKINDPMGTAIKLKEYFEVFSDDIAGFFIYFVPYAMFFSVFLCALEIVLGAALLLNWLRKLSVVLLFFLVLFFTFLTFYSAYFNKVTDCGCFGEFIKLTPWQSFTKDLILLILLGFLLALYRKHENKKALWPSIGVGFATSMSIFIAVYAIRHLPIVDMSNYAVGNHIPTLMKPEEPCRYQYGIIRKGENKVYDKWEADFMKDSIAIQEVPFSYKYYDASSGDSIDINDVRMDTIVKKVPNYDSMYMIPLNADKCLPKIMDFSFWGDSTGDITDNVLTGTKLLVIVYDLEHSIKENYEAINTLTKDLGTGSGLESMVITSVSGNKFAPFANEVKLTLPFFYGDSKVLMTIVRANPGLVLLKDGVIKGKWHSNDVPSKEALLDKLK